MGAQLGHHSMPRNMQLTANCICSSLLGNSVARVLSMVSSLCALERILQDPPTEFLHAMDACQKMHFISLPIMWNKCSKKYSGPIV